MPRHNRIADGLIPGSCKIRKRGCSSSSSSSSLVQNYRFKRAILVGKPLGSRSSTPAPSWRTTSLRVPKESPKYEPSLGGGGGRSRPVSARKLAATLWEMNEIPSSSATIRESVNEKKLLKKEMRLREKMGSVPRSVHSGSLPPHLSDPSHSPASERMDRSGTGSRHRKTPSISRRPQLAECNVGVMDSLSSAALMEIETRSRPPTSSGSIVGVRTRLKDVSNALTTSKELLKIINRIWSHDNQPSTSMSLISALHADLERARLLVNQLIQEQRSDQNEFNYLMKCLAEEKAAWRNKEQQAVEAAIASVAGELKVERKLRRRSESLNKKLGRELTDTKAAFLKAVKELESEKRAREIMEQMCDDLARDIGADKAAIQELMESPVIHQEVEKEREMLHVANISREERVQKISETKHQFVEKNAAVNKLRNQFEAFSGTKKGRQKNSFLNLRCKEEIATYLHSKQNGEKEESGEAEDEDDCEECSGESELHSIELMMDNMKNYKPPYFPVKAHFSRKVSVDDEITGRNSTSFKDPRRTMSLKGSLADVVELGIHGESLQDPGDSLDLQRLYEFEAQGQRRSCGDNVQRHKWVTGRRDQILLNSSVGSSKGFASPTRQWGPPRPSQDLGNMVQQKAHMVQGSGFNSRLMDALAEAQVARKSNR